MGISNTFDITGSALNAQSIHIDTIAKNMANSQVASGSEAEAYKAKRPEFAAVLGDAFSSFGTRGGSFGGVDNEGVKVNRFTESIAPVERQRMPESPLADADGYVYFSNVNIVEEMAYMMEASRAYQSNVEVLNTSKQLMLSTLNMGNK